MIDSVKLPPLKSCFLLIFLLILISCSDNEQFFDGGSGTEANPYQISTVEQLQEIGEEENLEMHFIQVADIDATESFEMQNGSGFQPIGTREQPFTGSYNGNGHTISSLFIHNQRSDTNNATGFFGYVKNGLIENVTIDNVSPGWLKKNVDTEHFRNSAELLEVHKNDVDLSSARGVGGLIGFNDGGIVRNCIYKGNTEGFISQGVGGFAGVNNGLIENSHYTGDVSSGAAAGFAFTNAGQIRNSSATGSANGQTAGGFVQFNYGEISYSYADVNVIGSNGAAGFVRSNESGVIRSSFVKGSTYGGHYVAGFVVNNSGEIRDVYATTDLEVVDYNDNRKIAGLVVNNEENGIIENSYFAGDVEISGNTSFTKAAIIENRGSVEPFYWDMERSDLNSAVAEGAPEGATGLTTEQMTGPSAETNMPEFDWMNTWRTTDGYPVLRWEQE